MNGTLTATVFVVLWGLVLVRLPTLLRDAKQRALWATCFTLALCKVTALDSVNTRLLVPANRVQLVPNLLAVACVFFLLRFISLITDYYASRPRAARNQLVVSCAVAVLLVALATLSPTGIHVSSAAPLTADGPLPVVYWVVLNTYLGGIVGAAMALFWRMSRDAPPGTLRTGLRCLGAGLLVIVLYAVQRVVVVMAHAFGVTLPVATIAPVADGLRAVGLLLVLVGASIPATGWVHSVAQAYRSLRALGPLWQTMRRAFPDVILFSRRRAVVERFGVDDVHLRLYRRVIEIRDGMLVLRDHLPPGAGAGARAFLDTRGTDHPHPAALAEACCIELALHQLRSGHRPLASGSQWANVGADLADEVRWMRLVSSSLQRDEPSEFVCWWMRRHADGVEANLVTERGVEPVG
jgi:hypothetical protein